MHHQSDGGQLMGKALTKYSKLSIHNSFLFVSLYRMLGAGGSCQSKSPGAVNVMRVCAASEDTDPV